MELKQKNEILSTVSRSEMEKLRSKISVLGEYSSKKYSKCNDDIQNPYRKNLEFYRNCFEEIEDCVKNMVRQFY